MTAPDSTDYRETLRTPASWWAGGVVLCAALWWVFWLSAGWPAAAVVAAVAAVLVALALVRYGGVRLSTGPDGFRAGRATLGWQYVGTAEPLHGEAIRRALGVDADARAFLLVRAYCGGAVRVAVDDMADPAPYWLISTRHAKALAEHLNAGAVQD
ncbi:MAG TPA: DUF3093 domain-containing protein [Nocardioidaceae bacterium]|nr:DUF3093 domain-containing protein [Nocardioidaceae bacterium]